MSETTAPWYRSEPWLAMLLGAIVPIVAAIALPEAFRLPLLAIGAVLLAIGVVLLVRGGSLHEAPEQDIASHAEGEAS